MLLLKCLAVFCAIGPDTLNVFVSPRCVQHGSKIARVSLMVFVSRHAC